MTGVWGEPWPEYLKDLDRGTPRIIRKDLEDLNQKQTQFIGTFLLALARLGSDGSQGMPQMDPAVLEEMLMLLVPWLRTMQYDDEFCLYPHSALVYIREAITRLRSPYDYDTRFVRDKASLVPVIRPYVTAECGRWVESCGFIRCGKRECSGRVMEYIPCRAVAPMTAVDDGAVILDGMCSGVHDYHRRDPEKTFFSPTNAALIREGRALTRMSRVTLELTGDAMAFLDVTHPTYYRERICMAVLHEGTTELIVGKHGVYEYYSFIPGPPAEYKYPPGFTFDEEICATRLRVSLGDCGRARILHMEFFD